MKFYRGRILIQVDVTSSLNDYHFLMCILCWWSLVKLLVAKINVWNGQRTTIKFYVCKVTYVCFVCHSGCLVRAS